MEPAAGERLVRYVGDWLRFSLAGAGADCRVFLRTNIGRAAALRREIIHEIREPEVQVETAWRDVPMRYSGGEWSVEFALAEVGWFQAKAYVVDRDGNQHWPEGDNIGLSVHPNDARCANTIYCCFPRMFGPNKSARSTTGRDEDENIQRLDEEGYTVIPPSGTFRDVIAELPHIMGTLGCRILHLLPVNSTPTTYARMGRFGSPYACGDLTDIDPALVQFDKRATGVQQFCELTDAVHARGGRLFLDLVINHTGWGSTLQENHPEWFLREDNGEFASPGAWGNTWGDLVELEPHHRGLWGHLANAFLTWCRRGVDGFRCDAGYKVPMPVWRYIIARVREEFPDTIFLLEGLGGGWEDTENLLTKGGMQWAYSELFQEYSGDNIAGYLDHALLQSPRIGTLVHYSETHDNPRLAERGRQWSLMRNQLSALTSINGGYGFTNGVEWLADEKVNVHNARGMNWGSDNNIVPELSQLNRLLAEHPCFQDGSACRRLSERDSTVFALERTSSSGERVFVLVNSDADNPYELVLQRDDIGFDEHWVDLLNDAPVAGDWHPSHVRFTMQPGEVRCFAHAAAAEPDDYRAQRTRVAWAIQCLANKFEPEEIGQCEWRELSVLIARNPEAFVAVIDRLDAGEGKLLEEITSAIGRGEYRQIASWRRADATRVLPVAHGHWLMVRDEQPFRVSLGSVHHAESVPVDDGHVAAFPPGLSGNVKIIMRRLDEKPQPVEGEIVFLPNQPANEKFDASTVRVDAEPIDQPIALLTNGHGAMARLGVDLGAIKSKYDCLLGANLHDTLPVDRQVLAKRIRAWAVADGFITPLNADNLLDFKPGPPCSWRFLVSAGDNRTVEVELTAAMPAGQNATVLEFHRVDAVPMQGSPLADSKSFSLTVRVDIEDRSFHSETHLNDDAYHHFEEHTQPWAKGTGFCYDYDDRRLVVEANGGCYHHDFEWTKEIAHPVEASRGHAPSGDACSPGWFELPLAPGERVTVAASTSGLDNSPDQKGNAGNESEFTGSFTDRLRMSLQCFIVRRGKGKTVIAGYPWFLDWGRDTLIVSRGMLAAGMVDEVSDIVRTYAALEENGTLPNSLRGDDASNRDTSDAPLWLGVVCAELADFGVNLNELRADGRSVKEVLQSIASHYRDGTPNGIYMDARSGLIWSPTHFTWMDTNHPAGSPREGYPVEIQALWLRLLRSLGDEWSEQLQHSVDSFVTYFQSDKKWLADQLIAGQGVTAEEATADNALRSNGLMAVALGEVTGEAAQRMVLAAQHHLVVPGAVRSLAPLAVSPPLPVRSNDGVLLNNPNSPYRGRYEGDEDTQRKPAYHNGTAWVWSLPVFCEALVRAWKFSPESMAAARSYLLSMESLLNVGCLGHLPEVLDGDAPHTQRGCDAQAWSVSEAYRVWRLLNENE